MRLIAGRLIAYEASQNESSETNVTAAFGVCDRLRRALGKLAGVAGFRSLLLRALTLAKAEVAWLEALQLKADGSLEYPEQKAALAQAEMVQGEIVLVAQLLGLLVTFTGESLTWSLLQEVWPGLPMKEFE